MEVRVTTCAAREPALARSRAANQHEMRQAMSSTQEAVRVRVRTPAIVALGDKVSVGLRTGSRRTLPSMDVDPTCPICGEPLLVSGARIIVQYRTEDSWQGIHEDCGGSSEGAAG